MVKQLIHALVMTTLLTGPVSAQQTWPCPTYPIMSNLKLSWPKPGYGKLGLRFMAPNKPLQPTSWSRGTGIYRPDHIEVTGPGSRPWVASGDVIVACELITPRGDGIPDLVWATATGFTGDAYQVPGEDGEPDDCTDCNDNYDSGFPDPGTEWEVVDEVGDVDACHPEAGCGDGDDDEGGYWLCVVIDWFYVDYYGFERYAYTTVECYPLDH